MIVHWHAAVEVDNYTTERRSLTHPFAIFPKMQPNDLTVAVAFLLSS